MQRDLTDTKHTMVTVVALAGDWNTTFVVTILDVELIRASPSSNIQARNISRPLHTVDSTSDSGQPRNTQTANSSDASPTTTEPAARVTP